MSEPWAQEELDAIWREVITESDRGCVLLAGAMLDRGLERLLRLKFHQLSSASDSDIDKVLSFKEAKACLVGFTARARLAYLMGLINKPTCTALIRFAKVRNAFAHQDTAPPLEVETIRPVSDALPAAPAADWRGCFDVMLNEDSIYRGHKQSRRALAILTITLHVILKEARWKVVNQDDQQPKVLVQIGPQQEMPTASIRVTIDPKPDEYSQ